MQDVSLDNSVSLGAEVEYKKYVAPAVVRDMNVNMQFAMNVL